MDNGFTLAQNAWLLSGIALLAFAVLFFVRGKTGVSLVIIVLGGLILRLLMTSTDPFLYDWDEQYHALVAKHLIAHPGTPMLYDEPLLPVDYKEWAHNSIWLHKPPLFLWLIALSVKFFGTTPFAVKLPSILLSTLMIPALYFMVKRITGERAAWIAALLLAAHSYSIQLVSGFRNTDHNDVIFSAFVLFTFWAWIRYTDRQRKRDAILAGLLVGCAVLVKWLPGILVFGCWGLWMLQKQNRATRMKWIHFSLAIIAAIVFVLPWYVHIYRNFPAEAAYESHYNFLHMTIAMEGHEGPWYYHFDAIRELMGWVAAIAALPCLFLFATRDTQQKRALYIVAAVVFFFLFYTIAKTKMPLFMLPLVPFLLAGIAVGIDQLLGMTGNRKFIAACALIVLSVFMLDPFSLVINHSSRSELAWYRDEMWGVRNKADFYLKEKSQSADSAQRVVMFNFPENERAAFMFYTGDIVYNQLPSMDSLQLFRSKGFVVGVYDGNNIPEQWWASAEGIRRYFAHLK